MADEGHEEILRKGAGNKILRAAQEEAGVKFHLHSLRHLHSSLLVQAGANIKQAQARLGHANASTTMNIYSHVLDDESRTFSEKVEAAFPFVSVSLAGNQIQAALPESVK